MIRSGGVVLGLALAVNGVGCILRSDKKSDYEIHRDELIDLQQLSRSKMEELLGAENYKRCCDAMLRAYDEFAGQLPVLTGRNNYSQFYNSAPFMLSLYRALRSEFALDQETALNYLSQITNFKVRMDYERQPVTSFFMAHVADSGLVRKLSMTKFEYPDEAYGWAVELPESDAVITANFTRCGLVDWFTAQGAPEIAPVACEGDYVWAELMKGLKFVRTQTLANGDPMCDFRYVKE